MCLLGNKIDPLVRKYLKASRYKGGVVNTMVAIVTTKALTKRYPLLEKDHLELEKYWAQSLLHRTKTTAKVKIPVGAKKKPELKFLHQITNNVVKHQLPASLIINFHQTPSKCVQVLSTIMDQKGESSVPIADISDKRNVTATFSITLDKKFLPMQLIYQVKTSQSLPKVKFMDGFSLSVNERHYSNENEALKFIEEIILPNIREECEKFGCPNQKVLLIFGQTTVKILKVPEDNNTLATKVPSNMTHLFQPLDLT